ncbi:MAG: (deoxy)nucleoside triphosphate pyrophosphohydrolase [Eubacteriales bacterium]|nr:(deoxy)nucleoside triphosphate pyrophosphohydrolase [Eubacteriales bacterium]
MMVVTAGVIRRGEQVLIAQRRKDDTMGGLWEFPGGGVDKGETPDMCVVRELREELGVEAHPVELLDSMMVSGGRIFILFYLCTIEGEPAALEPQRVCWCAPDELAKYPFAPADMFIADRLARGVYD